MSTTALKIAPTEPTPRKRAPRVRREPTPIPTPKNDHLYAYATAGVAVNAVLSALLNGYAYAHHAAIAWAGWLMGLGIPIVILIAAKVAGRCHKRGRNRLAAVTAGSAVGLLGLSVWHCATSISMLTGSGLILAIPMAVAIDVGFVCCEIAAIEENV